MKQFHISKSNLQDIQLVQCEALGIEEGEIALKIDHFAFTSNNITYGVIGEKFKYWNFFPFSETKGIIPVWGYATVIESKSSQIKRGDRYYGYYPMASNVRLKPGKISNYGLVDMSEHRMELPSFYNYYEKVPSGAKDESHENVSMLFNPLFGTSFLLNEFYSENSFFGSSNIVLTSASSKTAIALAYILKKANSQIRIIGFTSEANYALVESLNIYDKVYSYSDLLSLDKRETCIVDFAGNKNFMHQLQNHLIPNLKFCSVVGLSHWDKQNHKVKYPFKAELFFAPAYGAAKLKEWGMAEYKKRMNQKLNPFLEWTSNWLEIDRINEEGIIKVYSEMLAGNVNPQKGIIMSLVD